MLETAQATDKTYWENYYKAGVAPEEPSLFAQHVLNEHASVGDSMVELGCGNGRDARYFAANGIGVLAIDQCASEIDQLIHTNGKYDNLHYEAGDFTELPNSDEPFDIIYSRFTLHSVNAEGQRKALEWSHRNLSALGRLCIETRGQKNELYQRGAAVEGEQDAYIYNDHYRRFVDFEEFKQEITQIGFVVIRAAEQTGFAPFEDTDYHFIRVIAQK